MKKNKNLNQFNKLWNSKCWDYAKIGDKTIYETNWVFAQLMVWGYDRQLRVVHDVLESIYIQQENPFEYSQSKFSWKEEFNWVSKNKVGWNVNPRQWTIKRKWNFDMLTSTQTNLLQNTKTKNTEVEKTEESIFTPYWRMLKELLMLELVPRNEEKSDEL